MSDDRVLKYLAEKVKEEREKITDDMAFGKAKDFGDYKYAAGVVRGFDVVTSILIDVSERLGKEEDD